MIQKHINDNLIFFGTVLCLMLLVIFTTLYDNKKEKEFRDKWVAKHGSALLVECVNGILIEKYPHGGKEVINIVKQGKDKLVVRCNDAISIGVIEAPSPVVNLKR